MTIIFNNDEVALFTFVGVIASVCVVGWLFVSIIILVDKGLKKG